MIGALDIKAILVQLLCFYVEFSTRLTVRINYNHETSVRRNIGG